ncbi:MAG: insulinase family protein [candidate division Zixibacteria bacterium]|nr:insulinase family protein [candidate division Zixibacteria bacterium]
MKGSSFWLAVTACLVLLAAPALFGFDFSALEKSVSETTLDNGLKIIVMERHDAPVASFVTFANVGGVDDPKEYTGLAHMLEHMAFKGTTTLGTTDLEAELKAMAVEDSIWALLRAERKKGLQADSTRLTELQIAFDDAIEAANEYVKSNEFNHILKKEGGISINAGTGKDHTGYIVSLPSNKLELWMAMESERFLNPVLREMYRERNVIVNERLQVLDNNPISRTIDAMASTAFSAHPYGISIIGHMSDIENYNRDAVREYFKKYYIPSNLIVAIVGDVKPKEVFKLAKKYWGRIPSGPKPERVATIEPPQKGEKRVTLHDPAQPLFAVAYHIPSGTHPDWPIFEAISDYLGQGRTSLLYKNLVKEKKIASNVGTWAGYPGNKYPCLCFAYAMPATGHTNEECEEQILAEIERLKDELIPVEEVEKIKARAKAGFVNGLRDNMGMAYQLAAYENDWGGWREMFRELDRINAVTPEDIQRVAKEYFTEENRTIAKLNTVEG